MCYWILRTNLNYFQIFSAQYCPCPSRTGEIGGTNQAGHGMHALTDYAPLSQPSGGHNAEATGQNAESSSHPEQKSNGAGDYSGGESAAPASGQSQPASVSGEKMIRKNEKNFNIILEIFK